MPRQRFIHPDFWTDPNIGKLTPVERLFFIGCFSNADDEGRLLGDPACLRSVIFPYDDIKISECREIRDRVLAVCPNLQLYIVDGIAYLAFRHWNRYQNPRYPKPSKLPLPADDIAADMQPAENNLATNSLQACGEKDESMLLDGVTGFGFGLGRDGFGFGFGMGDENPPMCEKTSRSLVQSAEDESADTQGSNAHTKKSNAHSVKVQYAEYVSMTNAEHEKLLSTYGQADTKRMVEKLDNYKGSTGKKYRSDYRAILSWVADEVMKNKRETVVNRQKTSLGLLQELYNEEVARSGTS